MSKIAIQGGVGSFHYAAAQSYFGESVVTENYNSFKEAVTALDTEPSISHALLAIENSLYGSINEVYDLLLQTKSQIVGEVYLRIEQCLIGLPGATIESINSVYSHPVALAQCDDFLSSHLPQAVRFEAADTAESVADIKEWNDPSKAAIASKVAAVIHQLPVMSSGIETNAQNYTRFVVISRTEDHALEKTKTSIVLQTNIDTKSGALHAALSVFAKHKLNLTLIHSRPIVGKAWHYMFYIDFTHPSTEARDRALRDLIKLGCTITQLGSYTGDKHESLVYTDRQNGTS